VRTDLTPCHTGAAALTCGFDAALAEVDVDTGEFQAVTAPPISPLDIRALMLQAALYGGIVVLDGA
jgi:hypothetical protein